MSSFAGNTSDCGCGTLRNVAVSGNITIGNNDGITVYLVDTTAARSITLPAAAAFQGGFGLIFKDKTGTASGFNITLIRNGSDTIEGAASDYIINIDRASAWIYPDGVSAWHVI